jgi:N utilization substance protein B
MDPIDGAEQGGGAPVGRSGTREAASARTRAREVALQVLYAIDLTQHRPRPAEPDATAAPPSPPVALEEIEGQSPEEVFEIVSAHFPIPERARTFARELVAEVRRHTPELDEMIGAHSQNWRVVRMAAVDRNILRLGVYELRFTDTPPPVVLNESVGLARRFSLDPSPAFVNGILDAVARTLSEQGA